MLILQEGEIRRVLASTIPYVIIKNYIRGDPYAQ